MNENPVLPESGLKFKFYTSKEYWAELIRQINKTRPPGRILLTTMSFMPSEPVVAEVMQVLIAAAKRGVNTTLLVDARTFLAKRRAIGEKPGPLWYGRSLPKRLRQPYEYRLRSLQQLGLEPSGEFAIINPPARRFQLPIAGRSHIKLALINNQVLLGGCNLQGTPLIDMMVAFNDPGLADWLYSLFKKVQADKQVLKALNGQDISHQIDTSTKLLIDAGNKQQSIILDSAIQLIDSAKQWVLITCQFFPNGITAAALKRAHQRGVKVEIIFSHPSMHGPIGSVGHYLNMLRERRHMPPHFFAGMIAKENIMLHTKLLATDNGMMLGSHNYVSAGVTLGTAELTLLSHDPTCTRQALAAFRRAREV